jgi:DNA-binding protein H-NS
MATSLSKIKTQIEKLQKRADAIQTNVISRIKREIAQHGLTAEDLFGGGSIVGDGRSANPKKAAKVKKLEAIKPAKFADGKGNTWHGVGKRPDWIHEVLAAGRKLEEFLVGKKTKPDDDAKAAPRTTSRKTPAAKRTAASKKSSAKLVKAAKPVAAWKAVKAKPAAKAAAKAPAKKAATPSAGKRTAKAAPKRPAAKRPPKASSAPSSAVETPSAQA